MRLLLGLAMVGALAGCGTHTIHTSPGTYSLRDDVGVVAAERLALINGYPDSQMFEVADRLQVDLRQVTDTAIAMMSRQLRRDGVRLDPDAPRKVTIKVTGAQMTYIAIPFAERWRTSLDLDARFGDGNAVSVQAENAAPVAFRGATVLQRSVEGAVLFALRDLMNSRAFLNYVNR